MPIQISIPRLAALLAVAAAVSLGACGSSDDSSDSSSSTSTPAPASTDSGSTSASSGAASTVKLAAKADAIAFDTTKLTAKAGKVTLEMANPDGSIAPHAIAVEGNGIDKDGNTVTAGGTSKVTVDLKAGTYEFYCPVDGHKAQGMEGKLTVE
jgi:plastocyanin